MITLRNSAPRPTITCFKRSCVSGRANLTPASSIAIALASAGPIQIGSTRSPSRSCRITTGVLVVRSSPRWATRTSITAPASRPQIPRREVLLLLRGQRVDRHTHCLELQARDLAVQVDGNPVHGLTQLGTPLHDVLGRERLVREAHVHHARRVTLGGREVDQPPVGQHEQAFAVEPPLLYEFAHLRGPRGGPS